MFDRTMALHAFLAQASEQPFIWGERDCALWVADWIATVRGTDPAQAIRGRYRTAAGCARFLAREGGLPALASRLLAAIGLSDTASPQAGDVGLVETTLGPVMMICTGPVWAWKAPRGLLFTPAFPVKVWSV